MASSFGLAFGLLPSTGPGCNLNLIGLCGLAGAGEDLGLPNLVGVGRLDSLVVGWCPGLLGKTVRFGDPIIVLGVAAFLTCGGLPSPGSVPLRTSYGPAVFGRGGIFGAVLVLGLTGAPDKPPTFGLVAVVGSAVRPDALEAPDAVRMFRGGENSIAEPGLGRDGSMAEPGLDIAARWAFIVSLIEGLVPIVLREKPMPGRAGPVASVRLGVFGLLGSFSNNF